MFQFQQTVESEIYPLILIGIAHEIVYDVLYGTVFRKITVNTADGPAIVVMV